MAARFCIYLIFYLMGAIFPSLSFGNNKSGICANPLQRSVHEVLDKASEGLPQGMYPLSLKNGRTAGEINYTSRAQRHSRVHFLSSYLTDFDERKISQTVVRLARENKLKTSHFPPDVTPEDVLGPGTSLREMWSQIADVQATRKGYQKFTRTKTINGKVYQIEMLICSTHQCPGGLMKGEIVTIYPVCGPDIWVGKIPENGPREVLITKGVICR